MFIKAKGILDTLELEGNLFKIKGFSTLGLLKTYELNETTFKIKKLKLAGKILSGTLNFEAWVRSKKRDYNITFNSDENDNFKDIVEVLKYGSKEDAIICSVVGLNGAIELYSDKMIIKRDANTFVGFWSQGIKGDKEIFLRHVSAVQFKRPGTITRGLIIKGMEHNGYIQFTIEGGNESIVGIIGAVYDENTVFFNKKQTSDFEKLRKLVSDKLGERVKENALKSSNKDLDEFDKIEKLVKLRDTGILTEEEFEQKKKQLLGI